MRQRWLMVVWLVVVRTGPGAAVGGGGDGSFSTLGAVSDDTMAPVITASMSPPPNAAGWNDSDVTVTFTCSDETAINICTPPRRVIGEGAGIPVSGTAVDSSGNRTTQTWTVNIDRTAPLVRIYDPKDHAYLPPWVRSATVRGGVYDVSGIASISCDGAGATVVANAFTCVVPVVEGPNIVTIEARDVVGHSAVVQAFFSVGNPPVSAVEISPAQLTMFIGETRTIVVRDQEGGERHDGTWTVDNESVVRVSESNGVTTLNALAEGEARVTVTVNNHTGRARVMVFGTGATLPSGTTLWSLANDEVFGIAPRGKVLRTGSTATRDDPNKSPALLFVDEGTRWDGDYLLRSFLVDPAAGTYADRPTRIRTTTADGRQLSEVSFGGRIPQQIAADTNGGFLVVLPAAGVPQLPSSVQRFRGASGSLLWEYVAIGGFLTDAAIHPNGTVYVGEFHIRGTSALVAIDSSGRITKTALPTGRFVREDVGACGLGESATNAAHVSHPIITEDGTVLLLAHTSDTYRQVSSFVVDASGKCSERLLALQTTEHAYVVEVTGGALQTKEIDISRADIPGQLLEDKGLLPDGAGGLLVVDRKRPIATRVERLGDGTYKVAAYNNQLVPLDSTKYYETDYVLGEDGVYAVANSYLTSPGGPPKYTSRVLSFDPLTLGLLSESTLGNPMPAPQHVRLRFALAGGGAYASGPTTAYVVNAAVDGAGFAAGGNALPLGDEIWVGLSAAPTVATGGVALIAQTKWPGTAGTVLTEDKVSLDPYLGIFAKSHPVAWIGHHVSIRITPRQNAIWHARYPSIFKQTDAKGNWFATLGAGPNTSDDSILSCDSYYLTSDANRLGDVSKTATAFERLRYDPAKEDDLISRMLQLDANYRDDVRYCWNPNGRTTFNSNSYSAGLLRVAGIPPPTFPSMPLLFHVGWGQPLPPSQFQPH